MSRARVLADFVGGTSTISGTPTFTGSVTGAGTPSVAFQVVANDTDQDIPATTVTLLQWGSVELDTGSYWDSTNHRYTPQVAGWYEVGLILRLKYDSPPVGQIQLLVYKNGASYQSVVYQLSTDYFTNGSRPFGKAMVQMNGSSDYIDTRVYSDEAGTAHDNTAHNSRFFGSLIVPT